MLPKLCKNFVKFTYFAMTVFIDALRDSLPGAGQLCPRDEVHVVELVEQNHLRKKLCRRSKVQIMHVEIIKQ